MRDEIRAIDAEALERESRGSHVHVHVGSAPSSVAMQQPAEGSPRALESPTASARVNLIRWMMETGFDVNGRRFNASTQHKLLTRVAQESQARSPSSDSASASANANDRAEPQSRAEETWTSFDAFKDVYNRTLLNTLEKINLYGCYQSLMKMHPLFDQALLGVSLPFPTKMANVFHDLK